MSGWGPQVGASSSGGGGGLTAATTPTTANVVTTLANVEYSYTFPANTKQFALQARGNAKIQIAFSSGQSNTTFTTIFAGSMYTVFGVALVSLTVYFQSNKANETVELLSWV